MNYAVGDRYMIAALLGEDRALRLSDYPRLLTALHDRNLGEFDLRTVKKRTTSSVRIRTMPAVGEERIR